MQRALGGQEQFSEYGFLGQNGDESSEARGFHRGVQAINMLLLTPFGDPHVKYYLN